MKSAILLLLIVFTLISCSKNTYTDIEESNENYVLLHEINDLTIPLEIDDDEFIELASSFIVNNLKKDSVVLFKPDIELQTVTLSVISNDDVDTPSNPEAIIRWCSTPISDRFGCIRAALAFLRQGCTRIVSVSVNFGAYHYEVFDCP